MYIHLINHYWSIIILFQRLYITLLSATLLCGINHLLNVCIVLISNWLSCCAQSFRFSNTLATKNWKEDILLDGCIHIQTNVKVQKQCKRGKQLASKLWFKNISPQMKNILHYLSGGQNLWEWGLSHTMLKITKKL